MGCGCNKRRKKRRQSSRMPVSPNQKQATTIGGIKLPTNPSFDERRSAVAKINNGKINKARKQTVADRVKARKESEG